MSRTGYETVCSLIRDEEGLLHRRWGLVITEDGRERQHFPDLSSRRAEVYTLALYLSQLHPEPSQLKDILQDFAAEQ